MYELRRNPRSEPRREKRRARLLSRLLLAASFWLLCSPATPAQTLKFRFIGNAAYEITDGETTLLTDFPYKPGAFGYMTYPKEEVRPRKDSLCLFTHTHDDHFSATKLKMIGCTVAGPKQLTSSRMLPKVPVLPYADVMTFKSLQITPISTPHADLEHYSNGVTWHGVKLYFTGDTESIKAAAQASDLDVLFITPWLLQDLIKAKKEPLAKKVVIYHQKPMEKVAACSSCVVPLQGDVFEVPWK